MHRIELVVANSIKSNQYLQKFGDGLKRTTWFSKNLVRQFKQLGRLKNIPWVESRERALTLMERNYRVLVFEFENKTDGKYQSAKRAKGDWKFLKNTKHLFYLDFFQGLAHL